MTDSLEQLNREVVACVKCPRLVDFRRHVARTKRRMYLEWEYWGRPLPGFGDPQARLFIVGLAPAAHGGNRTGRMFTGDRSGDWVYGTLHKFGFASAPDSIHKDDGLSLRDAYITSVARCVPPDNKPLPEEMANCRPYLLRELALLSGIRVVVALGKIAFDGYLKARGEFGLALPKPLPRFAHGEASELQGGITLIASYHPSQRNTQTGRLTREMFEGVFAMARRELDVAGFNET